MTRETILNMEAGRWMDLLIHRNVLNAEEHTANDLIDGYPIGLPHYSTDIAAAWKLAEKLNMAIVPVENPIGWVCDCDQRTDIEWHWYEREIYQWAYAETAPLAICRAALLAVMDEQ